MSNLASAASCSAARDCVRSASSAKRMLTLREGLRNCLVSAFCSAGRGYVLLGSGVVE